METPIKTLTNTPKLADRAYSDASRRTFGKNVPGEQRALCGAHRIERNDPGKFLRIVEPVRARGEKQVRHAISVEIFLDRDVGRRSQRAGDGEHLIRLDPSRRVCSSAFEGLKALSSEIRLTRRPLMPPRSTIWK